LPPRADIALISLGCPKNQVDSEVLLAHLCQGGYRLVEDPARADLVLVNTCAFIEEAREEAVETLLEMARLKQEGRLRGVIALGCLPQRYGEELARAMGEVDAFVPISDYSRLGGVAARVLAEGPCGLVPGGEPKGEGADLVRLPLSPPSYAYLRVAEGCNHRCTYCAIPAIRGPLRSKPLPLLVEEARRLAGLGVRELVLVAEDTTAYGADRDEPGLDLAALLQALDGVEGVAWVRVLYGYPGSVTGELLETMAELPSVVPYLDLPIQHTEGPVLKAMGRGGRGGRLRELLHRIREKVPGIALRTSILVGHPGEREEHFRALCDFVAHFRFERLGAFAWSPEEGTAAAEMEERPAPEEAQRRREELMALQREIVLARNAKLAGQELEAIIDGRERPGLFTGRTQADAPEVDCRVLVRSERDLEPGSILPLRVEGHEDYDLRGRSLR
jgi:ribosomal protein S12 methylthiotransferase